MVVLVHISLSFTSGRSDHDLGRRPRLRLRRAGVGGVCTPPTGICHALTKNTDSSYTLLTHDQVSYHFTTAGLCDTIKDANSNTISLSYSSDLLTTITDPRAER